jgi:hypothetical protein
MTIMGSTRLSIIFFNYVDFCGIRILGDFGVDTIVVDMVALLVTGREYTLDLADILLVIGVMRRAVHTVTAVPGSGHSEETHRELAMEKVRWKTKDLRTHSELPERGVLD